jgi:hypothetical protein
MPKWAFGQNPSSSNGKTGFVFSKWVNLTTFTTHPK